VKELRCEFQSGSILAASLENFIQYFSFGQTYSLLVFKSHSDTPAYLALNELGQVIEMLQLCQLSAVTGNKFSAFWQGQLTLCFLSCTLPGTQPGSLKAKWAHLLCCITQNLEIKIDVQITLQVLETFV